jgi:hypothetical protein
MKRSIATFDSFFDQTEAYDSSSGPCPTELPQIRSSHIISGGQCSMPLWNRTLSASPRKSFFAKGQFLQG